MNHVEFLFEQIENEYDNVQVPYKENGKKYIEWAANMVVKLYNVIPWIMCKQKEAPPSVVRYIIIFIIIVSFKKKNFRM